MSELAAVPGMVNQSSGHIRVYSEPGHGTIFKVCLSRVDETNEPIEAGPASPAPAFVDRQQIQQVLANLIKN